MFSISGNEQMFILFIQPFKQFSQSLLFLFSSVIKAKQTAKFKTESPSLYKEKMESFHTQSG